MALAVVVMSDPSAFSRTINHAGKPSFALYVISALTSAGLDRKNGTAPVPLFAKEKNTTPRHFELFQNYPNPFNPSTWIEYNLENAVQVSLRIYNLLGVEVALLVNGRQEAGSYSVQFNTGTEVGGLPTGIYFYRLEAGSFTDLKKLILIR
jgi:hypothetical protein